VKGARSRGTPKRTWREAVKKECQASKLNREDAMLWIVVDGEADKG